MRQSPLECLAVEYGDSTILNTTVDLEYAHLLSDLDVCGLSTTGHDSKWTGEGGEAQIPCGQSRARVADVIWNATGKACYTDRYGN